MRRTYRDKMRPGQRIPGGRYSLTVAADFTTANGQTFRGIVGVTTVERKLDICQGVILDGREPYLFIANPEFGGYAKANTDLAAGLGLPESKVFPIGYTLRVPVAGE